MRIAVFGLGYVGCVTGACLAQMGHEVCGVDISPAKVHMINQGHAPLKERGVERLVSQMVRSGKFRATLDPAEAIEPAEISLVCVGTPSGKGGSADLDYVLRAVSEIGAALRRHQGFHTMAVRSTMPPGTMEQFVIPVLEQSARQKTGARLHVCFHPEFLREGSSIEDFFNPPHTIIGIPHPGGASQIVKLWRPIKAPLYLTSFKVAEMLKYADNAFHALKVSFANEVGAISKTLGIDGREVMGIFAEDRKLNLSPLYLIPGFAFGGPCLPKDLRALEKIAEDGGIETPLVSSILKSNLRHLIRARDLILSTGKRRLGVLGLVFKSDTDDLRESPACQLVRELVNARKQVRVYDPQVNLERLIGANRAYVEDELPELPSLLAHSLDEVLAASEVIVISGTHPEFATAVRRLRKNQMAIDLVGLAPPTTSRAAIKGLCW
jgi:GDP-mannose 6-dehydrogenase